VEALHAEAVRKVCIFEGCDRRATRRGLCNKHYQRVVFRGETLPPLSEWHVRRSLRERFYEKTREADSVRDGMTTPCVHWTGSKDKNGYGRIGVGSKADKTKRNELSHRIAWILEHGELDDSICVLHKCDNPQCVNVEHLFLGTKTDNNRDMVAKGRMVFQVHPEKHPHGEGHFAAKLTDALVRKIRETNLPTRRIARALGMSNTTVAMARKGKTWKHVQPSCLMAAKTPAAARACGSVLCEGAR
jgi:hypothetical protein